MQTIELIKKKFEVYQYWFKSLLLKEFMNLPIKYQNKFIILVESFLKDCKDLYNEAQNIREKNIEIKIIDIIVPDEDKDYYTVIGYTKEGEREFKIIYPKENSEIIPEMGSKTICTLFSIDSIHWYSSKEDLIKGK